LQAATMKELGRPGSLFEAIGKPFAGETRMADDRRRHPRKTSLIPVSFVMDQKEWRDFILNISSGGVFIGTSAGVFLDREILMHFVHPSTRKNLSLVGRVAWANPAGMGVRFKRLVQNGQGDSALVDRGGSLYSEQKREVKSMGRIKKRRICWEPSMSDDVVKYRLYWSENGLVDYTSNSADVGSITEVIIPDDIPSFPRFKGDVAIGVTAVNDAGNESDLTKMTAKINFIVPDAPTNLVVEEV
jgi:Tfp pilus assembly protein PilZ